ncbi:MAG: helix-turn-helix domain-containing protein [Clostridia bacterium]|nr:helix-turn-helix domain-containing protein [Clostridia bacterium]
MNKATYVERIKQLRVEDGLSQAQLAKAVGISQSAIAVWELGARTPSADAIIKLAEYFGVTADYILGLSDDIN